MAKRLFCKAVMEINHFADPFQIDGKTKFLSLIEGEIPIEIFKIESAALCVIFDSVSLFGKKAIGNIVAHFDIEAELLLE